jgi:hypothetical protein
MNIVLPKTLAEPLTIPWFVTREVTARNVKNAMLDYYMQMRLGLGITVEQLLIALECEAIRNGATMTSTAYSKLLHAQGNKLTHVGWQYRVYFKCDMVDNGSLHVQIIDGWFDGNSYLANKKYRIYRSDPEHIIE